MIFYLINLHISAWSKIFDHIQKILNAVKFFFELADGIGINIKRHQFMNMKKNMGTLMKYTHVAKYRKTFRLMRQICFNGGIDDA